MCLSRRNTTSESEKVISMARYLVAGKNNWAMLGLRLSSLFTPQELNFRMRERGWDLKIISTVKQSNKLESAAAQSAHVKSGQNIHKKGTCMK